MSIFFKLKVKMSNKNQHYLKLKAKEFYKKIVIPMNKAQK